MIARRNISPELYFVCAIADCTFNLIGFKSFVFAVTAKVFITKYKALSAVITVLPGDLTVVVADGWRTW